jgi:hypothetical protein
MGFTINEDRGGVIARLLFLVVLVMVGLPYMARAVLESPRTSPEAYAVSSVRKVVTSQFTYSETIGGGAYADSLDSLYASNLIDSVLASGTKEGYTVTVTGAGNASFAVYVRPITYGKMSIRSFYSDETGVIRYTAEERPATVEDTPLGQ